MVNALRNNQFGGSPFSPFSNLTTRSTDSPLWTRRLIFLESRQHPKSPEILLVFKFRGTHTEQSSLAPPNFAQKRGADPSPQHSTQKRKDNGEGVRPRFLCKAGCTMKFHCK